MTPELAGIVEGIASGVLVRVPATDPCVNVVTGTRTGTAAHAYLVNAESWGATAGAEWACDVRAQWHVRAQWQTVTGTASTSLTVNGAWGDWGGCDRRWDTIQPLPLTPEQEGRRRREEQRQDRAKWKAHELLLRHLSCRQREDYEELKRFTVRTRRGHRYVIGSSRSQNVVRVNRRGRPMRAYCVTVHGVPLEDALLGQKLMLDHDEDHFLRVARQWPLRFALGVGDLVTKKRPSMWVVPIPTVTVAA